MRVGKVVGTVVSTQKVDRLVGGKLLVVQEHSVYGEPMNAYTVAVDTVGAGEGDMVLTCAGSSARMTDATEKVPVDSAIVAIIDNVKVDGRITYKKGDDR